MMIKILGLIIGLLAASSAQAQNQPLFATGVLTPGHALVLQQAGTPGSAVTRDAGPAIAGNFTELGITNDGLPFCIRSKAQQYLLCLGANALGGALISYNPLGLAPPQGLTFNINGTNYAFPGTGTGNVTGPVSTIINRLVCWNNTGGTAIADCSTTAIANLIGNNTGALSSQGANLTVQNSATTVSNITGVVGSFSLGVPPHFDVIAGVLNNPAGSANADNHVFGAYGINFAVGGNQGNLVGYYAVIAAGANSAQVWGDNYIVSDEPAGNAVGTLTNVFVIGSEIDYVTYNTTTHVEGIGLEANFVVQPATANGFQLSSGANGSPGKWFNGFVASPGCCSDAAFIAGSTAGTGTNIGSQPIQMFGVDGGGLGIVYTLAIDTLGNLDINSGTNGPHAIGTNNSINMQQSATNSYDIGADRIAIENPAHILFLASGPAITAITLGNSAASLNLSVASLAMNGTAAVTCPTGSPTASFATANGIVTHC